MTQQHLKVRNSSPTFSTGPALVTAVLRVWCTHTLSTPCAPSSIIGSQGISPPVLDGCRLSPHLSHHPNSFWLLATMALPCTARLIVHPSMVVVSKNPRMMLPPPPLHHHTQRLTSSFALHSVDVSKDDKPLDAATTTPPPAADTKQEDDGGGGPKLDPRRFEEKFAVLNTGIHECRSCGYRYDQAAGDPSYPVPPGLPFEQLPDDWRCPTCGAAQSFFENKSVEIAGFAENQQFGLGGNSLTAGQKGLLIYGSLFLGFLFFLSGYFLQ